MRALGLAMANPSSKPEVSHGHAELQMQFCLSEAQQPHLARRTPTGSCCRPCRELGWATGGSWARRCVCPPPGHEEHDDGGCKTGAAESRKGD